MKSDMQNTGLDLSKFEKIEDIIFLDEPILTHLIKNNKHFLLYLVDSLSDSDIYLLFEIEESDIYSYITCKKSLRKLIEENQNLCFIIEQNFEGKIINTKITHSAYIDENYLPSSDSFLNYEPTTHSYYYKFITEYKAKSYLNILREKAFYLKFAVKDKKYAETIGFNELASNLIFNLSSSFKSFLRADFIEEFKSKFSDENKLNKIFISLLPELDFRMVDLKFGSFEIGLAVDDVMKGSIEDPIMKDWAIKVGAKYKDIVLDDKYNEDSIKTIINSYSAEDRKKIFEPIFKISENQNFNLQVKKNKDSKYVPIKITNKNTIERIIPKNIDKPEIEKEYQIVNVTTVVDKNKTSKSISLSDNTLFSSTDHTEVTIENKDFNRFGYPIDFNISIKVKISVHKNLIMLNASYDSQEFNVESSTGKLDDGIKNLTHLIFEYLSSKRE